MTCCLVLGEDAWECWWLCWQLSADHIFIQLLYGVCTLQGTGCTAESKAKCLPPVSSQSAGKIDNNYVAKSLPLENVVWVTGKQLFQIGRSKKTSLNGDLKQMRINKASNEWK